MGGLGEGNPGDAEVEGWEKVNLEILQAPIEVEVLAGREDSPEEVMLGADAHDGVDPMHFVQNAQPLHLRLPAAEGVSSENNGTQSKNGNRSKFCFCE